MLLAFRIVALGIGPIEERRPLMRPSEFEAIRPNLKRAVGDINADFEKRRQLLEIAKELEGQFDWSAAPEADPAKDEAKDEPRSYRYTGKPVRSRPLLEYASPWRHSAEQAARDLCDCGWTKEAETIAEVLRDLPTGPVDGNQPETLERQLDAIRAGAERIKAILTTCLEEQSPAPEPKKKAVHDPPLAEPDGPVAPNAFRWNGKLFEGLQEVPWRLVDALWIAKNQTLPIDTELGRLVWFDHAEVPGDDQIGGARNKANRFFLQHSVPLAVSKSSSTHVSLKTAKRP